MRKYILFILYFSIFILPASPQEKISLWEGTPVKAKSVTLEVFEAKTPDENHTAIIVCPGGSYCWHDYKTEGKGVAEWLSENGITAFVLKYRVQGYWDYILHSRLVHRGHQHPDMISDLQRAIQYVRENATRYSVNPNRIGAMGFSAGGHLVMSAAEFFHTDFPSLSGVKSNISPRPDFVAPIYPVVSASDKVSHKRSRRALLGEKGKKDKTLRDSLSLEKHVPADCPPVFLVNCKDDPVVKYQNSVLLDSALTAKGVPHKYIQYKTGGHGFGASDKKGTAECRGWKEEFLKWIERLL